VRPNGLVAVTFPNRRDGLLERRREGVPRGLLKWAHSATIVRIPLASRPYASFSKPILPSTTLSKLQSGNVLRSASAGGRIPPALICSMQHVLVPWNVLPCRLRTCWRERGVKALFTEYQAETRRTRLLHRLTFRLVYLIDFFI